VGQSKVGWYTLRVKTAWLCLGMAVKCKKQWRGEVLSVKCCCFVQKQQHFTATALFLVFLAGLQDLGWANYVLGLIICGSSDYTIL